jgi:ABC-type antimicrobial peptide transport system permease subunit
LFYITYLHRELRRRMGRTVLTVLGLAVGVALVVVISALSRGLDDAQAKVLDPLEKVGTDLVVSRPIDVPVAGQQGGQAGGAGGAGAGLLTGINPKEVDALIDENQSLFETDFSTLGKPGETFERELFLPATQLTFEQSRTRAIADLDGVDAVAGSLSLLTVHQKGEVPEIVAEVQTGGQTFDISKNIPAPTQAEWNSIQSCVQRTKGASNCLPGRFKSLIVSFTTPREVIKQVLDPPKTDLATEPYTAAGVDVAHPDLGLITSSQILQGKYFSNSAAQEVVLAQSYAKRKKLVVGKDLTLNGKPYEIVGLARPPLGGQSADVYLPLDDLQELSGRGPRVNMLFVRAERAADVAGLAREIKRVFPGAQVTSAEDLAASISGSLVDAGNLTDRLGYAMAGIALVSAVLIAVLLTLSSVAKRVRELGTLAALGWNKALVVRQVVAESLTQGGLGGLLGLVIGSGAALAISAVAPTLDARASAQSGPLSSSFGLGQVLAEQAKETISLKAPLDPMVMALAVVLAILGGLVAGAAGAVRASRLRPADALRELG